MREIGTDCGRRWDLGIKSWSEILNANGKWNCRV
jgi:hypothetical protein